MNKSHARKPIWWYRSAGDIARKAKISHPSPGVKIKAKQNSGTRSMEHYSDPEGPYTDKPLAD